MKTMAHYSTLPEKKIEIPGGLDLNDITPAILEVTRNANDLRWNITPDLCP